MDFTVFFFFSSLSVTHFEGKPSEFFTDWPLLFVGLSGGLPSSQVAERRGGMHVHPGRRRTRLGAVTTKTTFSLKPNHAGSIRLSWSGAGR